MSNDLLNHRTRAGSGHIKFTSRIKDKKNKKFTNFDKVTIARANPKKAGFLVIGKFSYKKYFYWILGEDVLYYFATENDENPKGEFLLSIYNKTNIVNESKFTFELCSSEKCVLLRADSKASMTAWLEKLTQVQKEIASNKIYVTGRARKEHNLYVKVWEAKDLLNAKDTFCVVLANGTELARSTTIWNKQSPHYFSDWTFNIPSYTEFITIGVYDFRGKNNFLIGTTDIPINTENKGIPSWYFLKGTTEGVENVHLTIDISKNERQYKMIVTRVLGFTSNVKGNFNVVVKIPPSLEVYSMENPSTGNWKSPSWIFDMSITKLLLEVYFTPSAKDSKNDSKVTRDLIGQVELTAEDLEYRCSKHDYKLTAPFRGKVRVDVKYTTMTVLNDDNYDELFSLLCEGNMKLPKMISTLSVNNPAVIAESLVKVFERRRVSVSFLKEIIGDQIRNTLDATVIFRSNTLATKAFDSYLKLTCLPHLHKMIKPIIMEMYKGKKSCELDTTRVSDEKSLKRNRANLLEYCEQIFKSICESTNYLPLALRTIFEDMRKNLLYQFPNDEAVIYSGPSGFIFLRFICPAILGPTLFGLSNEHPQVNVARDFTLVAKTLQTLANSTLFDKNDSFMAELNDFIIQKQSVLKAFLNEISEIPRKPINEIPTAHTRINFGQEMAYLVEYLEENFSSLDEAFSGDETVLKLKEVLEKIRELDKQAQDSNLKNPSDEFSLSQSVGTGSSFLKSSVSFSGPLLPTMESSALSEDGETSESLISHGSPDSKFPKNFPQDSIPELFEIPGQTSEEKLSNCVKLLQENLSTLQKNYTRLQEKHLLLTEEHRENGNTIQILTQQTDSLITDIYKIREEESISTRKWNDVIPSVKKRDE